MLNDWNKNQAIEVPETLLKKRKQNEKAREERIAAATAARKVSPSIEFNLNLDLSISFYCDAYDSFDLKARGKLTMLPIN